MSKNQEKWWEEFFDDDFSAMFLDRENDSTLEPTADFLIATLDLKPGALVFDQCCGTGAFSIALAKRGVRVVGIDQASGYINRAVKSAENLNLENTIFEAADAFEYVTPSKCDAAFNWYTSFGYSNDDAVNIQMLHRVRESLKPDALFILDYMNVPNILANFKPVYTREQNVNGMTVEFQKHTEINHERGMIGSRWIYKFPDGSEREGRGESRLYMPEDIGGLFEQAGFENIQYWGGFDGEACDEQAQRCFVMGKTP